MKRVLTAVCMYKAGSTSYYLGDVQNKHPQQPPGCVTPLSIAGNYIPVVPGYGPALVIMIIL